MMFKVTLNFFNALLLLGCMATTQMSWAQNSPKNKDQYSGEALSTNSAEVPEELKGVGITEHLGDKVDLTLPVINEKGETVSLSTYFQKGKPVLLSPIYFACPGLCSFHFNGVIDALKKVDWNPGQKFEVVAFSFDAKETHEVGEKKKINYMKMYDRAGTDGGFHFLTAPQSTVDQLMNQVGFKFKWNEKINEWAHASAAIMISPEGKITRYLHGIEFNPQDLKLALNESGEGKVGNIIDSAILYCFKYDQHQSKYGLQVFRVMQIGGLLMILLLGIWLFPIWFKGRREKG